MALTQRELGEVAREALDAQRAFEELAGALRDILSEHRGAETKVALLGFVLRETLPQVGCEKSARALEHIAATEKRNTARAKAARDARAERRLNYAKNGE